MTLECLPRNELEEFVSGKIESDRFDAIASHIDSCDRCQETIIAFDASDTIVAKLRAAREQPIEAQEDSVLENGLNRIIHDVKVPPGNGAVARQSPVSPIDSVGPYKIEECLGVGGMGTVYKATHTKLKRTVAIKILPAGRWANATAVTRFHREMEAIGKLDHPNIVRATDAGEHDGMHYLAMDFVDGLNLSQISKRIGILPVADACRLIQAAAIGLQYAHANDLIHRDIKPSNIMLSRALTSGTDATTEPAVKVLDLGLALLGTENLQHDNEFTTVGQLMGTLDYMSPEQGLDSHEIDTRADIYSLGATLFRLLTGRSPLGDAKYNTLMKKMTALATVPAPSIESIRDDLPSELVRIVDRMLSRDPDDRFDSARDVADALEPFSNEAELGELLQRALDSPAVEDNHGATFYPRLEFSSVQHDPSPVPATHSDSGNQGFLKRLGLAFFGFAAIAASIAIYVITDNGELIIRSEEPIQLEIKKGERIIEPRLVVDTKEKKIELRSGDYTISLIDAPASLTISKNEVTVNRNRNAIVTVEPNARPSRQAKPKVGESEGFATLTYGGRTLAEWRNVLDNDLKVEMLTEALAALTPSPTFRHPYEATLDDVFRIARIHGSDDGLAAANQILSNCKRIIESHDPAMASARILEEITEGNERSHRFLSFIFLNRSTTDPNERVFSRGLKAQIEAQYPSFVDAITTVFQKENPESRRWTLRFIPLLAHAIPPNNADTDKFTRLYVNALKVDEEDAVNAAFEFAGSQRQRLIPILEAMFKLIAENRLDDKFSQNIVGRTPLYQGETETAVAKLLVDLYHATQSDSIKKWILESVAKLEDSYDVTLPFLKDLAKKEKGSNLQNAKNALGIVKFNSRPKNTISSVNPPSYPPQSDVPTYSSLTFEQWFAKTKNERTPSSYLRVMPALSKLAQTDEQIEKVAELGFYIFREIVDVRGDSNNTQVSDEVMKGLMRLPADLVVAKLLEELEHEPTASSREYVGDLIADVSTVSNSYFQDFNSEMKAKRKEIAAKLLALSNSSSSTTQRWALDRLAEFCRQRKIDPNSLEGVVQRFQQELESDNVKRMADAAGFLQGVALKNEGLVEPLTSIVSRPFSEYDVAHDRSMHLLSNLKDESGLVSTAVLDVLERAARQTPENQHIKAVVWTALGIVEQMDKETLRKALPIFHQLAESYPDNLFHGRIRHILNRMEAPANSVEAVKNHNHATEKEAEECNVCRIALDSIKNAQAIVGNAKVQFDSGTADATDYVSARVHLLNMQLNYARIQNDDTKARELLKSIVEANSERIRHLEVRYQSGDGTLEALLKARQDLNAAKLMYEQEKAKKAPSLPEADRQESGLK